MENIKSFDCTPSPAMNVVMANFSSGTSTFNDSTLNPGHKTSGFLVGSALWTVSGNSASCMSWL